MLKIAEELLRHDYDSEEALQQQNEFLAELRDVPNDQIAAACTGYASVQAVTPAAVDQDMDDYDPDETDHDQDAYMWDSSYYASMAAAGGDPSVTGASISRRRAFWQWYLEEAVPQAYRSVSD